MSVNNFHSAEYHKIKSMEVESGFLDGMKIEFDYNFNCLIGEKGTVCLQKFWTLLTQN